MNDPARRMCNFYALSGSEEKRVDRRVSMNRMRIECVEY
jgi:hypothetical protein